VTGVAERLAIVTGGSRGIGAATARRLAAEAWNVLLTYRSEATAARQVVDECRQAGVWADAVALDVTSEAGVEDLFASLPAESGELRGLVNNAGVVAPRSTVAEMRGDRIRRMLEVNVLGVFLCSREAVRLMGTAGGGSGGAIVNISSRAAVLGSPGEYVDYAASKAAVDAMTTGLAKEVADDGIRVNSVRLGLIDTEIHARNGEPDRLARLAPSIPMRRPGDASEAASAICWLLSDAASYTTGAHLDVAGGR
jgi:NAD(P)-dependent dehydrogenase (short-subunit alcohol dehydrogenase family)